MDVSVTSVAYHGDEATATVRFQAKGNNSPNAGMSMQYVLTRQGNQWVVKGRAGGEGHSGMPQGMPGGSAAPGAGSMGAMPTLPNGQPSGTLPPGHPSIGSPGKSSDGR